MKLLFDHNLSYKLVARLADLCPDAAHVRNATLHEADDRTVWEYARANGFAIVSQRPKRLKVRAVASWCLL